jgi:hypothetical protein
LEDDLGAIDGPAFFVRMSQLVFENGALTQGEAGKIVNPHSGAAVSSAAEYHEAVIAFSAEFYILRSNSLNYINNLDLSDGDSDGRPDSLGRPLFTRNLAVRR